MDQLIFLRILGIILVMTRGYKKNCNVSQLIYKRCIEKWKQHPCGCTDQNLVQVLKHKIESEDNTKATPIINSDN